MNLTMKQLMSPDAAEGQGGVPAGEQQPPSGQPAQEQQAQPQSSKTAESIFGGGSPSAGQEQPAGAPAGQLASAAPAGQAAGGSGQPPAAQPAGLPSEDAITKLANELRQQNQRLQQMAQPQQPQPQMSEEEFNKLFNVVQPTEQQLGDLLSGDPTKALPALGALLQGAVRQAATLSAYHTMQEIQQLRGMVQPALQVAETANMEKMKTEFFTAYPDLKGLEPLLLTIRDGMITQKRMFETKEAAFKAVAEEARNLLAKIPGLQAGAQQPQGAAPNGAGQPANAQRRQMPTLSSKGQAGGQGGGAPAKSTAERIFGGRS